MRALLALVLFIPVAAFAGSLDRKPLRMPDDMTQAPKSPDEPKVRLEPYRPLKTDNLPLKTLNLGPFEAEIGGQSEDGKDHHFARYQLEGTRILGGSVGGSIDGGSAKLELTWPSH